MTKRKSPLDLLSLGEEAVAILKYLISVDTSQGSEIILARYLGQALQKEGIAAIIYEPFPGRGSLVARLPGGSKPPLVLLSHLDTATAHKAADWPFPPFSGAVEDGYICGRGAIDCKGLTAVHLLVFLAIKSLGIKLDRDLYLVSAAGEEEGGHVGTSWLLAHLPPLREAGYVLGEGGGFTLKTSEGLMQMCQAGEKGKLKISLKSSLRKEQLAALARATLGKLQTDFCLPLPPSLTEKLDMESMTTNRFHIQNNEVTFELLPGMDVEQCWRYFSQATSQGDPEAIITIKDCFPGTLSSIETPLFTALSRETGKLHKASLVPFITPGYSDNRYFRERGATVYGFQPLLPGHHPGWIHGTGERLSVASLKLGMEAIFNTITTTLL